MESISIARLTAGSIYRLVLVGLLCGFVPLGVIFGVLGFTGYGTVKWNGEPITGPSALYAGPLISIFLALMLSLFLGSVSVLGLWLFSKFRPFKLMYIPISSSSIADAS